MASVRGTELGKLKMENGGRNTDIRNSKFVIRNCARSFFALLPMLLVILVRLAGPEDLDHNDQAKQALYVLDIRTAGNWILPLEQGVAMATKPPLYAWLAALASATEDARSVFVCRLPSMLAALGVVALLFLIGTERWGSAAGTAAAWAFAASHTAVKLSIHIRPDMVLTLCTTASLFALHRLERNDAGATPRVARQGWMAALFWAGIAFGILAKGPPAIVVAGGGLAALAFARPWRGVVAELFRSHGILFLLLPAVWFLLAYMVGGNAYLRTVVLPETVERVLGTGAGGDRGHFPGYLVGDFLVKTAPWSIITVMGLVEIVRCRATQAVGGPFRARPGGPVGGRSPLPQPDSGTTYFAAAWFLPGLLLFSLSRGQREDYLLPLLPGAALLAAREIVRWAPGAGGPAWRRIVLLGAAAGILCLHLAASVGMSTAARSGRGDDLEAFVREVERLRAPGDEIVFCGTLGNGVRFMLGVNRPSVPPDRVPTAGSRGGRVWVVAAEDGAAELGAQRPGRFVERVRRPWGRDGRRELVLLEAAPE